MAQRKVNRKQAQIEKMQAALASLEEEIEALRADATYTASHPLLNR